MLGTCITADFEKNQLADIILYKSVYICTNVSIYMHNASIYKQIVKELKTVLISRLECLLIN